MQSGNDIEEVEILARMWLHEVLKWIIPNGSWNHEKYVTKWDILNDVWYVEWIYNLMSLMYNRQ